MDIFVRNKDLETIGIVDVIESIVWVDKFNDHGHVELYTAVTQPLLELLQEDYYLSINGSDHTMIIQSIQIKTDVEKGNKLFVRGRSLESILDRRIVIGQTLIDGSMQDAIELLLDENMINSSQPMRDIPGFVFSPSVDSAITGLTLNAQYDGDNIYDIVVYLAKKSDIGFKIILNANNEFVFSLYPGVDRSYDQSTNSFVVFSPDFDNLINSNYFQSSQFRKTYTLIYGDPSSGPAHRVEAYGLPVLETVFAEGLDRRETKTDASDLSKFIEGTTTELPVPDYLSQLAERGIENLRNQESFTEFEGQADTTNGFIYGVDFFLGDIVQIENEFGFKSRSRITEFTISEDLSGVNTYPTFTKL